MQPEPPAGAGRVNLQVGTPRSNRTPRESVEGSVRSAADAAVTPPKVKSAAKTAEELEEELTRVKVELAKAQSALAYRGAYALLSARTHAGRRRLREGRPTTAPDEPDSPPELIRTPRPATTALRTRPAHPVHVAHKPRTPRGGPGRRFSSDRAKKAAAQKAAEEAAAPPPKFEKSVQAERGPPVDEGPTGASLAASPRPAWARREEKDKRFYTASTDYGSWAEAGAFVPMSKWTGKRAPEWCSERHPHWKKPMDRSTDDWLKSSGSYGHPQCWTAIRSPTVVSENMHRTSYQLLLTLNQEPNQKPESPRKTPSGARALAPLAEGPGETA